jgi:hypothetical protein
MSGGEGVVNSKPDKTLVWHKSRLSDAENCIEIAAAGSEVLIRSSTDPRNTAFSVPMREWLAFLQGVRHGEFDLAKSETDSSPVTQMEIDIYLGTDGESVASSVFAAIDALARTLGVDDIVLTEIRRGSIIRRSKALDSSSTTGCRRSTASSVARAPYRTVAN